MKLLTKKQQHDIGIRLIALLKMCNSTSKGLPVNHYADYLDKYTTCVADIAEDVGGIGLMAAVLEKGFEE